MTPPPYQEAPSVPGAGVLFTLRPLNERARAATLHAINKHSLCFNTNGNPGLGIGHVGSSSADPFTLATLGRNGDIFLEEPFIARIQCSFEINPVSKVVMFYDRSFNHTSQVYAQPQPLNQLFPLEYGRLRKVVVAERCNNVIGMGGVHRDSYLFKLVWTDDCLNTIKLVSNRQEIPLQPNPRLAHTQDGTETAPLSRRQTRVHTAGNGEQKVRWMAVGESLGSGQFGEVHRGIDVDSGQLMAVKTLKPPETGTPKWERFYEYLKREIEILAGISHNHIVDYISSGGWSGPKPNIFMALKDGSLQGLIERGHGDPKDLPGLPDLAYILFNHILQALDHLAHNGIIHRDVKPENILFTHKNNQFTFLLGDFGLSNMVDMAATAVGSPLYMAPELLQPGPQTTKLDMWSFLVTMLWTLDAGGFRQIACNLKTHPDVYKAIGSAAATLPVLQEMCREDPHQRPSAAQLLVKHFEGNGLTTPLNEVAPFPYAFQPMAPPPSRNIRSFTQLFGGGRSGAMFIQDLRRRGPPHRMMLRTAPKASHRFNPLARGSPGRRPTRRSPRTNQAPAG